MEVKSGRIRSTPGCSSSGKSTPQSTISSRPPYSKTVMLRPISPRPPSGVMRRPPFGELRRGAEFGMRMAQKTLLTTHAGRAC